jgi:molybdopterin converting factor small subunit
MAFVLKLKYFVHFDQLMGKTESLEVEEGTSVKDLLTVLAAKYSGFPQSGFKTHLIILLNGTICTHDDKLSEGDGISILTPQVGG